MSSRLRTYGRIAVIVYKFLPIIAMSVVDSYLGGGERLRQRQAVRLRETLVDLGPTFIKLGQLLSTRPDIVPSEWMEELEKLQDDVPPAPWPKARAVIESELGSIDDRYDSLDTDPISGASLAQVYRATIDGRDVAVKVRRPELEKRVERDLAAIEKILAVVIRLLDDNRAFSVETLSEHFRETLYEEMDFAREARVMSKIRSDLEDDDRVIVPELVESHSTRKVLTMGFQGGTKLTHIDELDRMGVDRPQLAKNLHQLYLKMGLVSGLIHGDPHPGNIAVKPDGTAVLYDFGMSDAIPDDLQQKFLNFYYAFGTEDPDEVIDALAELGTLHPAAVDKSGDQLRDLIASQATAAQGGGLDLAGEDIEEIIYEIPFRLPKDMALVLRVLTIGDGVFKTVDPNHDMVESTAEMLARHDFAKDERVEEITETGIEMT